MLEFVTRLVDALDVMLTDKWVKDVYVKAIDNYYENIMKVKRESYLAVIK